ncbi:MAG: 4-alpha-glucanotransferase [Lachnospiraceae bacterium]|jgi:4-alpha-glucanotransferase|nr:4-alpha-glucanotransferase [Lachnospiraceae bacterium]
MRASGILMPITSLPSKYGIGCFSKEAYDFVDNLANAYQSYWQILPIGPTSYGDSPYQSFSTFAGNPYFIDLEQLVLEGLITNEEINQFDWGDNSEYIDYEKIYLSRKPILQIAFSRAELSKNTDYQLFREANSEWLYDYALYMAIKDHFGGIMWSEWKEDIKTREPEAINYYDNLLKSEMEYYEFVQFKFYEQWEKLKSYANEKGIKIIGDIPIYVAYDSADTWANPDVFQMDEKKNLTGQAGVPPDGFSKTGQLWGNPLYNWEYLKETGFSWWKKRIMHHVKIFDVIRIDHFRGFDAYYHVPAGDKTAEHGTWKPGPSFSFFQALQEELSQIDIIAEDLGYLTESVFKLLSDTGYPGMKILQFAFDSREAETSAYLPHNYIENSVVYTGTHDNETTRGWFKDLDKEDKKFFLSYIGRKDIDEEEAAEIVIRMAMSSVSKLCIIPIQDYLNLDNQARINTPSTLGGNWMWRLKVGQLTEETFKTVKQITKIYGRKQVRK